MSKTEENLKKAFVKECQANLRYVFFAEMADELGHPQIADMFRSIAKGEECHAKGFLFYLAKLGVVKVNGVKDALEISIEKELDETENMYPEIAEEAREEGHEDIAKWVERVGKAEGRHMKACKKLLESLD